MMVAAWHTNTHASFWAGVKRSLLWERGEEVETTTLAKKTSEHSSVLICEKLQITLTLNRHAYVAQQAARAQYVPE